VEAEAEAEVEVKAVVEAEVEVRAGEEARLAAELEAVVGAGVEEVVEKEVVAAEWRQREAEVVWRQGRCTCRGRQRAPAASRRPRQGSRASP
jgi:hypothetical protein